MGKTYVGSSRINIQQRTIRGDDKIFNFEIVNFLFVHITYVTFNYDFPIVYFLLCVVILDILVVPFIILNIGHWSVGYN